MTGRLVVSDDGAGITLAAWRGDDCAFTASLGPHEAVRLATDLLNAAAPRFGRITEKETTDDRR